MPTVEPGPERDALGFVDAVRSSFAFLVSDFGLEERPAASTLVRYEGPRRFVNVFHGRSSYELGVEVGRWIEVDGEVVEQRFPLGYAVALAADPGRVGFRAFSATTAETVARFVPQLADWAREYIGPVIVADDDRAFDRMSAQAAQASQAYLQEGRASTLRRRADAAWRERDLDQVVMAYREILGELPLVQLTRSELGRLHYAEDKLDSGAG